MGFALVLDCVFNQHFSKFACFFIAAGFFYLFILGLELRKKYCFTRKILTIIFDFNVL